MVEARGESSRQGRASTRPAELALLGTALIWGINIPVMKAAIENFHPFPFNAIRLSMSAVVLGAIDHVERRGAAPPPTPWRRIVVLGLLSSTLYQMLFILGMKATTGGNTALLIASSPIWTAVIGRAARSETLRATAWTGLLIAFAGTALVTFERGDVELASTHFTGNVLVLLGAITWAAATVLSRPAFETVSPTRVAYLATLVSLPLHFAFAAPYLADVRANATPASWLAVVYGGVFSTGFAYAFWNIGVRRVGASHTAVYTNLVPVIAIAGSWMFLNEVPTLQQAAGGALILLGLVVMRRSRHKAAPPPQTSRQHGWTGSP